MINFLTQLGIRNTEEKVIIPKTIVVAPPPKTLDDILKWKKVRAAQGRLEKSGEDSDTLFKRPDGISREKRVVLDLKGFASWIGVVGEAAELTDEKPVITRINNDVELFNAIQDCYPGVKLVVGKVVKKLIKKIQRIVPSY